MSGDLFCLKVQGTVSIAATSVSSRVSLAKTPSATTIRVKNIHAANVAYINFGDVTVVATVAASIPIGPGETAGFTVPDITTHAAAICSGALTATVFFTPGWIR